jgi:hypothetical protein
MARIGFSVGQSAAKPVRSNAGIASIAAVSLRNRRRLLVIMNLVRLDARWILSPIFSSSVDAMAGVPWLQGCCAGRVRRV